MARMNAGPAWHRALALYAEAGYKVGPRLHIYVEWSRRLTASVGNCGRLVGRRARGPGHNYLIKLSAPIISGVAEGEREVAMEDTLIHELAHAFGRAHLGAKGHDARFRQVLRDVGRLDVAGNHTYASVQTQKGGRKWRKAMIVQFDYQGSPVIGRIMRCGAKRANVFLPGISWLCPYSMLREPAFGTMKGYVPFPWDLLKLGEEVGYSKNGKWISGVLENFGPTRGRVRFASGDYRLVPYGWLC